MEKATLEELHFLLDVPSRSDTLYVSCKAGLEAKPTFVPCTLGLIIAGKQRNLLGHLLTRQLGPFLSLVSPSARCRRHSYHPRLRQSRSILQRPHETEQQAFSQRTLGRIRMCRFADGHATHEKPPHCNSLFFLLHSEWLRSPQKCEPSFIPCLAFSFSCCLEALEG